MKFCYMVPITDMVTMRYFEVMCDKFNLEYVLMQIMYRNGSLIL